MSYPQLPPFPQLPSQAFGQPGAGTFPGQPQPQRTLNPPQGGGNAQGTWNSGRGPSGSPGHGQMPPPANHQAASNYTSPRDLAAGGSPHESDAIRLALAGSSSLASLGRAKSSFGPTRGSSFAEMAKQRKKENSTRHRLFAKLKMFSVWFYVLMFLNLGNLIVFTLTAKKFQQFKAAGAGEKIDHAVYTELSLWRECMLFTSMACSLIAVLWYLFSMFSNGLTRGWNYMSTAVVWLVTLGVAITSIAIFATGGGDGEKKFWAEFCGLLSQVFLPIVVFLMASAVTKKRVRKHKIETPLGRRGPFGGLIR